MPRLLIVSNRLPVTALFEKGTFRLERSSGGLASGLSRVQSNGELIWIGWPGEIGRSSATQKKVLDETLVNMGIKPVYLNRREVHGFYERVSNGVLWPLLHYRIDQLPLHPEGWDVFSKVSEKFAQAVVD